MGEWISTIYEDFLAIDKKINIFDLHIIKHECTKGEKFGFLDDAFHIIEGDIKVRA